MMKTIKEYFRHSQKVIMNHMMIKRKTLVSICHLLLLLSLYSPTENNNSDALN